MKYLLYRSRVSAASSGAFAGVAYLLFLAGQQQDRLARESFFFRQRYHSNASSDFTLAAVIFAASVVTALFARQFSKHAHGKYRNLKREVESLRRIPAA